MELEVTSKERVFRSISHDEPDRVPLYIWYHPDVSKLLAEEFNCHGIELEIALGNDILQAWVSMNLYQSLPVEEDTTFIDEFGIKWHRMGGYNMVIENPISTWDVKSLSDYQFPDPFKSDRYDKIKSLLLKYGNEKFIGADVSGSIFEPCSHIRGMEQLLFDLFSNPKDVEPLLNNAMNFCLQVSKNCLELNVDWIWLGDDVGTQTGMIFSPDMWRRYFKPRMLFIINELRKIKPNLIIAYHSCGSIKPIIPDLVEIGIDVLNPIQPRAIDMDTFEIKKQFGEKLTMLCGLDTQSTLPFGSLGEIESEIKKVLKYLSKNGGFIFAASHTIQPDVSKERILLVLEILKKYGNYPINI